jgi:hypothetical protein
LFLFHLKPEPGLTAAAVGSGIAFIILLKCTSNIRKFISLWNFCSFHWGKGIILFLAWGTFPLLENVICAF